MNEGNKLTGYTAKKYPFPTKRYFQTMNLKNDPKLIEMYIKRHSSEEHWPVIVEGIRSVGILDMEIFIFDNKLFMIVETPEDFDWDSAFAKLSTLPRQAEWEDYMAIFQDCEEGMSSSEKWQLMDRIFHLY